MAENTNLIIRDMEEVLSESFLTFAGYNIQRRAIPDARDGLKWGARQLLHAQMLGGFTYNKPFKKAIKSVSQAMGYSYVHGDASAYGTFIRMAKPFSYRYPLQEANGNYGTLINPDDHSASRYVELRGSKIASLLLEDLDKDTIDEWEDTYDLEGKFPKVLPSKGFYGIVNGCISIGSGMSCSIPPTNLVEVNNALIKLIQNPNIDDEEIICYPDFPTGATILNKEEVKQSLINGTGKACKIRSTVEFDSGEKCFIVKEMPYSTFTNTICSEIATIMEEDPECGIKNFVDYTGVKPDLRIYLDKKANPDKILKMLYKNTSLQTFYSINMVMLDGGKYPKVFTWREALQAHIDHEKIVYKRGFEHDLNKMKFRVHIIDGLLICIARIEEVIQTIKTSSSTTEASARLQKEYLLDADQAKAVLDLKLSRLAHLEVTKLNGEKNDLLEKICAIEQILNNEKLFNNELIKGWKEVAAKYGDARRTRILNISKEDEEEPAEVRNLILNFTNKGGIYVTESSSLYTQRRGGVGSKFKMEKGEYIVGTETGDNTDIVLLFSDKGNFFQIKMSEFPINEKVYITQFITMTATESICNAAVYAKNENKNIYFITKNGLLKKTLLSEYYLKRGNSARAINLDSDDEIVSVFFGNDDLDCGILSSDGNFIMFKTDDVKPIGRIARGVKAIKLNEGAFVQDARPIPKETKAIISVTKNGLTKQTNINEFSYTNKNTKGSKIQGLTTNDMVVSFDALGAETEIIVTSTTSQIRVAAAEIPMLSRSAQGVHVIKLKPLERVIQIEKI